MKAVFICSTGGHLTELLALKPLFSKYDSCLITERSATTSMLELDIPVHYLQFGTRRHLLRYPFIFLANFVRSLMLYWRLRPDVIITTGAHTAVPFALISSVLDKRIVFIESAARVSSKSISGQILEKHADLLLVQWPEMLDVYPNARYYGSLI